MGCRGISQAIDPDGAGERKRGPCLQYPTSEDISPSKNGGDWEIKRIVAFMRDEPTLTAMVMQDVTAADLAAYRDRRLKLVKSSPSCAR